MKNETTFTLDWAWLKREMRSAVIGYFKCMPLAAVLLCIVLALSGCATTRYSTAYCLTYEQFAELTRSQPPKVKDKLTGQADQDLKIVAGSAIRLRAHDDGLLGVLGGCVEPEKH